MSDGSEMWLKNGRLHREDGPALVRVRDNYVGFYLDGKPLSFGAWFRLEGKKHFSGPRLTFLLLKYQTERAQ